jgi:hypothetical protein
MAFQIEDFSRLPIGVKIGKGRIQMCPYCGKLGLLEETSERRWYTHSVWRGFNDDGNPECGWDMCPKTTTPKKTPYQ